MKLNRINWFGLAGGLTVVVLVFASVAFAYPWWQLEVGEGFFEAHTSPMNTNFSLLGNMLTIPLVYFLNLTCLLSLIASAVAMLFYSVLPTKSYSKDLLGFAYKKPLVTLLVFVIGLLIVTYAAGLLFQISFPMVGSTTVRLPASMSGGTEINVPIVTSFTWIFWLAVVAAALCIAARLYHKRIAPTQPPTQPN